MKLLFDWEVKLVLEKQTEEFDSALTEFIKDYTSKQNVNVHMDVNYEDGEIYLRVELR